MQQRITSAKTALRQVPALHKAKAAALPAGAWVVDYGCGQGLGCEYLREARPDLRVAGFDPFNQTEAENREAIAIMRIGSADVILCANVLNVIEEDWAIVEVVQALAKGIEDSGTVYVSVYEGDGKGYGRETSKGFQRNEKAESYRTWLEAVFPNVERKGNTFACWFE